MRKKIPHWKIMSFCSETFSEVCLFFFKGSDLISHLVAFYIKLILTVKTSLINTLAVDVLKLRFSMCLRP